MSQKVIMAGNILGESRPWLIRQTSDICAEKVARDQTLGWGGEEGQDSPENYCHLSCKRGKTGERLTESKQDSHRHFCH